jgi:phage FluMu gp28-like protein
MDDNGVINGDAMVSDAGLGLTDAVGHITRLFNKFDCRTVVIDETGIGAGPVEMLESELGENVVNGVKFTIDKKQSLFNALKSDLENGSVTLPDHRRLRQEFRELEYELTRGGKMKIHHPDGSGGHDDHPDAVALAALGRRQSSQGHATTSDDVVVL